MAYLLRNTENGGSDDIVATHNSINELKEDRRTSYINEEEYTIIFDGEYHSYMEIKIITFEPKVNEKPN